MASRQADAGEKERYLLLHSTRAKKTSGLLEQLRTAPLFSWSVKQAASNNEFPQYGFLGCEIPSAESQDRRHRAQSPDPLLLNTNTPWSAFICGSQGSGKSYTLSCILENCLYSSSKIGKLPRPLAGIVFHNDTRSNGSVCEAAYLASLRGIKVNVLVSRSNERSLRAIYEQTAGGRGNLTVHPLMLQSHHLNTERMHRLMAFSEQEGSVPLYMEVVMRILRDMAIASDTFSYETFKRLVDKEQFAGGQKAMMDLRFNLLESFLDMRSINGPGSRSGGGGSTPASTSDVFSPQPGTLTIVDLSDPFLDSSTVCILFDICLSLFEQKRPRQSGMVVALDEAHKYLGAKSSASDTFTEHLLTTIREQRHNATRVVIATQEPSVSPRLLDLCSFSLVHRFTSPDWLATLRGHLAGASPLAGAGAGAGASAGDEAGGDGASSRSTRLLGKLFEEIIDLDAGESLLFAPSAVVDVGRDGVLKKLGARYLRFKTRLRLGADGGRSVLAIRNRREEEESSDSESSSGLGETDGDNTEETGDDEISSSSSDEESDALSSDGR